MVFEADYNEAAINICQTFDLAYNPAPVASITVARDCPYGLAMDKTGTLYVVDNCGGNDVEEYAKGQTMLLKRLPAVSVRSTFTIRARRTQPPRSRGTAHRTRSAFKTKANPGKR